MDLPYYHGPLTKGQCEALLLNEGVDGSFLLRDSQSIPGVLCLCVSFKNFVYTYRIFREKHGYYRIQTAEGAPKQIFSNLKELVSKYEKPDQGLVVHLSKPIKRASAPSSRMQVELNDSYDIATTAVPTEASSPAQALLSQYQSSVLRPGKSGTLPAPDLGDPQNGEQLKRNCTIYRPWFSPYSYFVCRDRESHVEASSFPEVERDEGRGDSCLSEDVAESVYSSSSSQEDAGLQDASKTSRPGLDSITSQDILMASQWHLPQQNGYKCAGCCRMYPTLHSLEGHVKGGFREGFSCKVYYRKLKTLLGKEQKARLGDRLSLDSCQAFK